MPLVGLVAAAVDGRRALLQTGHQLHRGHADLSVVEGDVGAGYVAPGAVPHHPGGDAGQLVEALDEGRHLGGHGGAALLLFLQVALYGVGQAEDPLLAHLHGAAYAVGLLLDPLHILTLTEHQPAGGPFDGLGAAVDDEIRTLAVIEAQILFRRRIDDEREPVGSGHLGRLGHRQNALLHAVVGLDVEHSLA
ncbi:hypothetical protein D3C76_282730 [compost metagenome]